jgi:glutathione peroxidase-family protein
VFEAAMHYVCEKATGPGRTCTFRSGKVILQRAIERAQMQKLLETGKTDLLEKFISKKGRPFKAFLVAKDGAVSFEFEPRAAKAKTRAPKSDAPQEPIVKVDFTGQEPVGKCPKCGARVFENGMNYICEKATGAARTCDFRTGAVILQQAIDKAQVAKLLTEGRTELLKGFVSKKNGRKFEAFLVLKDGKVGFEFAPRVRKGPAKEKSDEPPAPKLDFTGQTSLGKCPKCGGQIFEGPEHYLCERSQADGKRCTFKLDKVKNGQPIAVEQLQKLLTTGKTDVLDKFVSRAGKPFAAWLTLKGKGKIEFEFPDRDG